jgi:isoleucyl-tRNA synthetase
LKNWEQLLEVRSEVLKILEIARKDKFIGDSLQAKVKLSSATKYQHLLKTYETFLPTLFIVSQVEVAESLPAGKYLYQSDDLSILVLRADGQKCERCWNYSTEVGSDQEFETVCQKCSVALREMGL